MRGVGRLIKHTVGVFEPFLEESFPHFIFLFYFKTSLKFNKMYKRNFYASRFMLCGAAVDCRYVCFLTHFPIVVISKRLQL